MYHSTNPNSHLKRKRKREKEREGGEEGEGFISGLYKKEIERRVQIDPMLSNNNEKSAFFTSFFFYI